MPDLLQLVLLIVLTVYFYLLIARVIVSWIFMFNPGFRARGAGAVVLEVVYTATDPPIKALQRVLPPLRVGRFAIDIGFILVLIVVQVLISIVRQA